ncbi:MAG TPA: precorrin-8X methylmutase [Acidimicrobiales bacterium]|nr:precorrin-8X methylmutase [Acidimicrobiales bacterium]
MSVVITRRCTACGSCITTCPDSALSPAPLMPAVDPDRCTDCLACLEVCPVDAIRPSAHPIHPIEVESYRIMNSEVDFSSWPVGQREVVARMVHATADDSFATSARVGTAAVDGAISALRSGAPVICDARMVMAGIPSVPTACCYLDQVDSAREGTTRSAAGMTAAAEDHPDGALWVIGNAPTALTALMEIQHRIRPAAIVGLPVGYVGAAAAKADLWAGPWRELAITNVGRKGGSAVAAAAVNALVRMAVDGEGRSDGAAAEGGGWRP